MTADRPLLGIVLMLGFCIIAPMGDSVAKYLGDSVPLGQLVLVRFMVQTVILLPILLILGKNLKMSARNMYLTFIRTLLHILGIGAMFLSLRYLPLADAVAIAFVMPFIMLVLGKVYLDEEVGKRRLIACAIGFGGTLLVVQPSFAEVGLLALLPIVVAFSFAFFMLVTRKLAKATDPMVMQCVSGFMATMLLLPISLLASFVGWAALAPINPSGTIWFWLGVLGVLGTIGHLLMTWSLRFAPSATLAPMQYLEIPVATFFGWVIFNDFPNDLALIGIVITMAAGLYVILRERQISQAASQSPV